MVRQDETRRYVAIEAAVLVALAIALWTVAGTTGVAIAGAVFAVWLGAELLFDVRMVYAYATGQLLAIPVLVDGIGVMEFIAVQLVLGGLLGVALVGRWSLETTALGLGVFVTATVILSTLRIVDPLAAGIFLLFLGYAVVAYWLHHHLTIQLVSEGRPQ